MATDSLSFPKFVLETSVHLPYPQLSASLTNNSRSAVSAFLNVIGIISIIVRAIMNKLQG
jgi:hypothetical protein